MTKLQYIMRRGMGIVGILFVIYTVAVLLLLFANLIALFFMPLMIFLLKAWCLKAAIFVVIGAVVAVINSFIRETKYHSQSILLLYCITLFCLVMATEIIKHIN